MGSTEKEIQRQNMDGLSEDSKQSVPTCSTQGTIYKLQKQ